MTKPLNGFPTEAPTPPAPKPSRKRAALKRFVILEVVDTVEGETEDAVRDRLPKGRVFQIVEVSK